LSYVYLSLALSPISVLKFRNGFSPNNALFPTPFSHNHSDRLSNSGTTTTKLAGVAWFSR
jgi:hypothetical protein